MCPQECTFATLPPQMADTHDVLAGESSIDYKPVPRFPKYSLRWRHTGVGCGFGNERARRNSEETP